MVAQRKVLVGWTLIVSFVLIESFALVPSSTMLINRNTRNTPSSFRSALAGTLDSNDTGGSRNPNGSLLNDNQVEQNDPHIYHITRSIPETALPFWLLSTTMTLGVLFAFGSEAFAETSPLYTSASSSSSLVDELGAAVLFVGDVLGSIIKLLYQVTLVVLPIIGKAIVAAGKAALPAIKQGLLAFFDYVKVAAQASGEAALPYIDEVKVVSTPYLQQVGSTVTDAATAAGSAVTVKAELTKSAVQNVATEQIKTVNSALLNVATQAKSSIQQ